MWRGFFLWIFLFVKLQCEAAIPNFHQEDYHIVQDKIELYDYNHSILQDAYGRSDKFNDSMKAISFGGLFLQEVVENFYFNLIFSKLAFEEYRALPFNFTLELCEEFSTLGSHNPFGIKTAIEISNFRGCPMHKNHHYHLNNWLLEEDKFPPHLPPGKYKIGARGWVENTQFLFDAAWFGEIVAIKGKKKKRKGK